jgi:outer membrane protein assembly factor BamB
MSPATTIADGLVYAAIADITSGGVLRFFFAVRADTGELVWRFLFKGADWSSVSAADGVVYFGGGSSKNVLAVDAQTDEELWSFQTEGTVHSTPVVDNGVVYVGSLDGHLYALN